MTGGDILAFSETTSSQCNGLPVKFRKVIMNKWQHPARKAATHFLLLTVMYAIYAAVMGCSSSPGADATMANFIDVASTDQLIEGWPVSMDDPQGRVLVYQPQPESLEGNQLKARAAVSLTPATGSPKFGAAWFTARVTTDRDTRTATLDNIRISLVRLPGASAPDQQQFANIVAGQLSQMSVSYSLDQLIATLDTANRKKLDAQEIGTAPPRIIFSNQPATLITVAGAPQWKPVMGQTGVSRVINTPFVLLHDDADHRFYLKEGSHWASAPDLQGTWQQNSPAPAGISAAGEALTTPPSGTASQPGAAPLTQPAADLSAPAANTAVIVSTAPAELIVTRGDPQFTPLPGGQLLYASNTESNLFLDSSSKQYFVLLSGRWYAAASLKGPWQYMAADKLPAAFAEIPADSPKADALTFVAHTPQAMDALLDAAVPQTAAIRRDAGTSLSVSYDGPPQFQPIPQCPGLSYAINTPEAVLQYNGEYYCCHQAVWYQSNAPAGPWAVSTSVPDIIYTIPPQNPLYNTTFVHVYDYYPDYVEEGYTPGYTGTYTDGPTVVYGTGYDYPAWSDEAYLPEAQTWGFDADYDPYTGFWGYDDGFYGGFGGWFGTPWGDRGWWGHNPGELWGAHHWWGEGGYLNRRDIRSRFGEAGQYGRFQNGDQPGGLAARIPGYVPHGAGWHNLYARQGNALRNMDLSRTNAFREPSVQSGETNDVFADHNGGVYRRTNSGWLQRSSEVSQQQDWAAYNRTPEAQPQYQTERQGGRSSAGGFGRSDAGLERDYGARSRGFSRASAFHSAGGGYHGGGASHGGGGHR
jgi:hypothetical protein